MKGSGGLGADGDPLKVSDVITINRFCDVQSQSILKFEALCAEHKLHASTFLRLWHYVLPVL